MAHIKAENNSVSTSLNSPLAVGLQDVRFMRESMPFSTKQLKAAAAPETNQIPKQANNPNSNSGPDGTPGTASTMPINAQKTMS
jgi:hypothetical protein